MVELGFLIEMSEIYFQISVWHLKWFI
uniref:Uncharacterized protein n=1 Tax=Anguilla anguilla TaxID=7936 RepID=A0A0E9R278_ANGAN